MTFLTRSEPTQLSVLQGVMQVERRLGGYLLDKPKQMLFHFTAANLCVSIEDFSPGWRCKQNANYQVLDKSHDVFIVREHEIILS